MVFGLHHSNFIMKQAHMPKMKTLRTDIPPLFPQAKPPREEFVAMSQDRAATVAVGASQPNALSLFRHALILLSLLN